MMLERSPSNVSKVKWHKYRSRYSNTIISLGSCTILVIRPVADKTLKTIVSTSLNLNQPALGPEMQKVADPADISVLFFSGGANFWAILGHFLSYFG